MKLSASNIGWAADDDQVMYRFLRGSGFGGLEIAPTRLFPKEPYRQLAQARAFADRLLMEFGLRVSSMQSIWYGRNENLFRSTEERAFLVEYSKRAVDFAAALHCTNLVFGCPKNRHIPQETANAEAIASEFFADLLAYSQPAGVVVAVEPNPPIYGTNYINTTQQAFDLCRTISGLKVNIDLGTMLYYNEPASLVANNMPLVNHIHLSEPRLVPLQQRELHKEILALPFEGYRSIEMANTGDISEIKNAIGYIANLGEHGA
jgi:sugar phosphate isomerase/epimerase